MTRTLYMTAIRIETALWVALLVGPVAFSQAADEKGSAAAAQRNADADLTSKRLFGFIPNARSSPSLTHYEPLTDKQKFKIAANDCFDRGTFFLGLLFGAEGQLSRSNPSFGNGLPAFGKYFGTAYGDFLIGNIMTEGVYPSLLHQDPRYFRKGTGSGWSRLGYSVKQTFVTRGDSGRMQFNYSEFLGNATAVAISQAYYPDSRTVGDGVSKFGSQIGIDMAANVLKEFGPDITRRFMRKRDKK